MNDLQAAELIREAENAPIYSSGWYKKCRVLKNYAVMHEKYSEDSADHSAKLMQITNYLREKNVNFPKTFYVGRDGEWLVTIQEFIEGNQLYLLPRNKDKAFLDHHFKNSDGEVDEKVLHELMYDYNVGQAKKLCNEKQEFFDKFLSDLIQCNFHNLRLEKKGENYIYTDNGLYIIDPEPELDSSLDEFAKKYGKTALMRHAVQQMKDILVRGFNYNLQLNPMRQKQDQIQQTKLSDVILNKCDISAGKIESFYKDNTKER